MNPLLIVIEAINAAGKTTQFNLLLRKLKQAGYQTHSIHFHQRDRATGQLIENKFLHNKKQSFFLSRREQALLYIQDFFSRAEDIKKYLDQKGKHVVVLDRFYTSTMAYQTIGLSREKRKKMISWISNLCLKGDPILPKPNRVILLDTPISISLQHLKKSKKDFFENKQKLTAIRTSYLKLAKEQKWTVINCADKQGKQRTTKDIHQEIWQHVQKQLS
jgi:dTMP kinase